MWHTNKDTNMSSQTIKYKIGTAKRISQSHANVVGERVMEIVLVMFLLQCKHLIVDWCWQPEYEWKNKGTYAHWGGMRHALKNALGTTLCFSPFVALPSLITILLIDYTIHYHVDYAKMNINRIKGWGPLTHNEFWYLTGFDQYLHQITYLLLIALFML